jgi:restriction system protein
MKKKTISLMDFRALAPVVAFLLCLSLLINNLDIFAAFLVACVLVGIASLWWHKKRKRLQVISLRNRLKEQVGVHESALISYYRQSRSQDQFGNIEESRWERQIDNFLRTKVVPDEKIFSNWRKSDLGVQAAAMVNRMTAELVAVQRQTSSLVDVDVRQLTPTDYEHYCADAFANEGWVVNVTQASRDGGADFYAEKNGFRLVAQCKRYSTPVGNSAVQEVVSALKLYDGNIACVIAPMGFTKQAQTEALCHSVHLLHHLELNSFSNRLLQE